MRRPLRIDGLPPPSARLAALALSMMLVRPAGAHHVIDGRIPLNGWEGLLSGLAHPVLSLDHFAFVLAAGLIALLHRRGALVPIAFVAASLVGTGIHRLSWNLPSPELMISLSVILFGVLLIARQLPLGVVVVLAAASGIFHGYAYGESIVGAEMTPLWAYLSGLALVQLSVGISTWWLMQKILQPTSSQGRQALRTAGVAIGIVGLAHLVT